MGEEEISAPTEYSHDKFDLTPLNVRYGPIDYVVKRVAHELDKPELVALDLDIVKSLLSRGIERSIEGGETKSQVPWPQSSEGKYNLLKLETKKKAENEPLYKGVNIFREGIDDFDYSDATDIDALEVLAFEAMEKLSPPDKKKATEWFLKVYQLTSATVGFYDFSFASFLGDAQNRPELMGITLDHIYENAEKYHYLLPYEYESDEVPFKGRTRLDDLVSALITIGVSEDFPHYLELQTDDEKVRKMLGIWVDMETYPTVVNKIRKQLEDQPSDKLERVGKMLIGADPDDKSTTFHKSLDEIYKLIDFEHYPPNLAATEHDVDLIMGLIKEGDVILDKACGTGRISNELAKRCKEKGLNVKIVSFDFSRENIKKAKEDDKTGSVLYFQGDWKSIPLKESGVDLIVDLGRNNTHSENWDGMLLALKEPMRLLKKGGKYLVDWPNPNKGEYLENRIKYAQILQSLGMQIRYELAIELSKNSKIVLEFLNVNNIVNHQSRQATEAAEQLASRVIRFGDAYGKAQGKPVDEFYSTIVSDWTETSWEVLVYDWEIGGCSCVTLQNVNEDSLNVLKGVQVTIPKSVYDRLFPSQSGVLTEEVGQVVTFPTP